MIMLSFKCQGQFQLLPFLIASKKDVDKALTLIINHYAIKKECPEFFHNRNVKAEGIQRSLKNQDFVILPSTRDHCSLILFRLSSFDPKDYDFEFAAKTYIMTFETAIFNNGPQNGMVGLIDMRGSRFGHLFRPSISSVRKGLRLLQEGCPIEVQRVHVLNTFPFVNAMMSEFLRKFVDLNICDCILNFFSHDKAFYLSDIPQQNSLAHLRHGL